MMGFEALKEETMYSTVVTVGYDFCLLQNKEELPSSSSGNFGAD
jgi:hypothetical protein